MKKKTDQITKMLETPISRLIPMLAVPTIITMLVSALYNTADTYFVSQINTSASGAVSVVFSVMAINQAIGFWIGMGTGSNISRLLGRGEEDTADEFGSTAVFFAFAFGIIICAIGNLFIHSIMGILGATETILPYAVEYARYIFIGAPFMCTSFVMNNILRSQGKAFFSMIGIGLGGLLNIALDPIFIFVLGLGIRGAAVATLISQLISFSILVYFMLSGKSLVKIKYNKISKNIDIYRRIMITGLPSFVRQTLASIATISLNFMAGGFGDYAVSAMGIVGKLAFIITAALLGLGQGFQPVVGFAFGAGKNKRVYKAYIFCLIVGTVFLTIAAAVFYFIAPDIVRQFRKDDIDVINLGTYALRIQCITLPLQPIVIITNMLLQITGFSAEATTVSFARQGIFFLPTVLILPRIFGTFGIALSQPMADILSAIVAIIFVKRFFSKVGKEDI